MNNIIFLNLQQLEQEKHRLRCELEVMEEEYEQRITELQSDLSGIFKFSMRTLLILHKHNIMYNKFKTCVLHKLYHFSHERASSRG